MKQLSEKIVCLKGADEICEFIKEDAQQLNNLVECENLPAWKRNGKGPWRALSVDLYEWLIFQREKYLKDTPRYLEAEKIKNKSYK